MADEVKNIVPDPVLQAFVDANKKKEEQAGEPAKTIEAPAEPKSEETKPVAETPKVEPEKPKASEAPKVDEVPISWDVNETPEVKTEPSKFDFSKLGSALELGEIKDEPDFITKVTELKTQLKQSKEAPLQGIPDDFKELIEITKKTGDWKTYLAESIVDYTKVSPVKLYEEQAFSELSKLQRFRNADGSAKEQEILDEIATISEVTKTVEGSRIQRYLSDQQAGRKAALLNQAKEKAVALEKEFTSATKNLNELLPFESYGIKFEQKHSNTIFEGVTTSKLTKKHLGVTYEDLTRSGANMKAVAKTFALAEFGEQMLKFKSDAALVKAKKELLSKVENAQITSPAVPASPVDAKDKTVLQKYMEHIQKQKATF